MRTVYKYPIPIDSEIAKIALPVGAKVVDFEFQGTRPFLWAEVNTVAATKERAFCIVGTGHPIPDNAEHIATCHPSPFVFHLYEIKESA